MSEPLLRKALPGFRWEGVELRAYKDEASAPFRSVTRQVLASSPDLKGELRYFEVAGTVRRALSVVKKRSGDHEHTIREYRLSKHGVTLGPPLTAFNGIFSGVPQYIGDKVPPMPNDADGTG